MTAGETRLIAGRAAPGDASVPAASMRSPHGAAGLNGEEPHDPSATPRLPAWDRARALFPPVQAPEIALRWLVRLRWLAIAGQLLATAVAHLLGLRAPLLPLAGVVAITALTNLAVSARLGRRVMPAWIVLALLLLDVSGLTVLLFFTGGPGNPFCILYIVHVAIAVVVLSRAWTWAVVIASAGGYGALFFWHRPLSPQQPMTQSTHDIGAWTSLVLVGSLIAYFSGRVTRSLRERDYELQCLRERNNRNEQLAALTTLAAGAAHELGTPLATIAVVSKELELATRQLAQRGDLVEDAQLIRAEVNRCRLILDRMRVEVVDDRSNVTTPLGGLIEKLLASLTGPEREQLQLVGPRGGDVLAAPPAAVQQALVVLIRNAIDASNEAGPMPSPATGDTTGTGHAGHAKTGAAASARIDLCANDAMNPTRPNTAGSPCGRSADHRSDRAVPRPVKMVVRRKAASIAFEVHDRGTGMSPDVMRRAGEPFFTTKEPGRGMGLGLFLVRLVAERSGGRFELRSVAGEGTCSTLELPLAQG